MNSVEFYKVHYNCTKQMLLILYDKIKLLRQKYITSIISEELIESEEKLIKLLAINNYYLRCNGKNIDECYLNILNIIRILNSSNFVIQAVKQFNLEIIEKTDFSNIEKYFYGRKNDVDVMKFIKSIQIIRKVMEIYTNKNIDSEHIIPEIDIKLPNDYLTRIMNGIIHRVCIIDDLQPRCINSEHEISSIKYVDIYKESKEESNGSPVTRNHEFKTRQVGILESCHFCNRFSLFLVKCTFCGIKIHTSCGRLVPKTCLKAFDNSNSSRDTPVENKPVKLERSKMLQKKGKNLTPITSPEGDSVIIRNQLAYYKAKEAGDTNECFNPEDEKLKDKKMSELNMPSIKSLQTSVRVNSKRIPFKRVTFLMDWLVPFPQIKLGTLIYSNRFGPVHVADYHGQALVNVFKKENVSDSELVDFRFKIQTLRKTRHRNLALFICASISHEVLAIITEYVSGVTLSKKIADDFNISDNSIFEIIGQILNGLAYLHSRKIVHMNLNPRNIFICRDKVKLCDFGLVNEENERKYIPTATYHDIKGFLIPKEWLSYQAPEILMRMNVSKPGEEARAYTYKTDIYAFGVILHELYFGHIPYPEISGYSEFYQICSALPLKTVPNSRNTDLMLTINKCICIEKDRFDDIDNVKEYIDKIPQKSNQAFRRFSASQ